MSGITFSRFESVKDWLKLINYDFEHFHSVHSQDLLATVESYYEDRKFMQLK